MALAAANTQRTSSEGARSSPTYTASDTVDLSFVSRGVHATADGYVKLTFVDDADAAPKELYVLKGVVYPYWVKRIWATPAGSPAGAVEPLL